MSEEDACVLNIEENYSDSEFPLIHDTDTDNESETEGNAENAVAAGYSGVYNWDSDSEEEDDLPKLRYRSRKRKEISSDTDSSDQEQGNDSDRRTENGTSHDEEGDEESDANSASHDEDRREHSDNVEIESNQQVSDSDDASHMDIKTITQIFRKKLKTYSISQRMAARLILKCSQSTVSELYAKAERHVTSKELSVRGKEPYQKMQEWLASEKLQKETRTAVAQQRAYGVKTPAKPRSKSKKAIKFTPIQLSVLVKLYQKDSRPPAKKTELIAEALSLEVSEIRTWYNNQRARNFPAGRERTSTENIPDDLDMFVNNY